MRKGKDIIQELSLRFAMDIVDLYKILTKNKKKYVMFKQLLRSGTSIGANVRESLSTMNSPFYIFHHQPLILHGPKLIKTNEVI